MSDFDGTITRIDFYTLVAERFIPPPRIDYLELHRQGAMSHFDAMASYYAFTPADNGHVTALLRDTDVDPRLADAVSRLEAASWDLVIVGRIFVVHQPDPRGGWCPGNGPFQSGTPGARTGLVLERATTSPFYSEEVGVDKAAVVRDALTRYRKVAFAGDGTSGRGRRTTRAARAAFCPGMAGGRATEPGRAVPPLRALVPNRRRAALKPSIYTEAMRFLLVWCLACSAALSQVPSREVLKQAAQEMIEARRTFTQQMVDSIFSFSELGYQGAAWSVRLRHGDSAEGRILGLPAERPECRRRSSPNGARASPSLGTHGRYRRPARNSP